jgi:murein DD-endopeptidase MepM/ murein hydrolase activator NlpD
MLPRGNLSWAEVFGLTEPGRRVAEVKMALGGDPYTPASRWGVSSVKIFRPRLSVKTWLGWRPEDRLVPVTNFFNRTPTPVEHGWSVRKTQVRDFRGGTSTYDSHNGTDFAIPAATVVVTPAPGIVRRISDEFHRGGLKILIDHGQGLITTSGHLGRALVNVGDEVVRGQAIALSAYSGIDAIVAFPWSVPHVHFNTWVNGRPVDPFGLEDEVSIWRVRNDPRPYDGDSPAAGFVPCEWDEDGLTAVINGCQDPRLKAVLAGTQDVARRAADTIFMKNYFPTRFAVDAPIYASEHERQPLLDLPFSAADYDGVRLL